MGNRGVVKDKSCKVFEQEHNLGVLKAHSSLISCLCTRFK